MKYIPCEQGSDEWYRARAGRITASNFAEAISVLQRVSGNKVKGDPTEASDKYAATVAIERVSRKPWGEPIKPWVLERGHELEPHARRAYERATGNVVEEAGVCATDDDVFGYSTDGLVNPSARTSLSEAMQAMVSCQGLIEIKCPVDARKVLMVWLTGDVTEYFEQMQGGMWITGAQWCDFVMYVPELASVGRDVYVQRVFRDDVFIDDLVDKLIGFQRRVDHLESQLRRPLPANELFQEAA